MGGNPGGNPCRRRLRGGSHGLPAARLPSHRRRLRPIRPLPPDRHPAHPPVPTGGCGGAVPEPALGVEEGGVHSAEALMLARYFMYTQVYFHTHRRVYDIHLKDFLAAWLSGGKFPTDLDLHLRGTDNEVYVGLLDAARDPASRAMRRPAASSSSTSKCFMSGIPTTLPRTRKPAEPSSRRPRPPLAPRMSGTTGFPPRRGGQRLPRADEGRSDRFCGRPFRCIAEFAGPVR